MSFFDSETERDIIAHMNADHGDAILAWVQAFTECRDASAAVMQSIDQTGTNVMCTSTTGDALQRVPFSPPLSSPGDVRARLIKLSREARRLIESDQKNTQQ